MLGRDAVRTAAGKHSGQQRAGAHQYHGLGLDGRELFHASLHLVLLSLLLLLLGLVIARWRVAQSLQT
jgi:hypothetical protein